MTHVHKSRVTVLVQVRDVSCLVRHSNGVDVEEIPPSLCVDAGLLMPESARSCGVAECPQWIAHRWNSCRKAKCVAKNQGERMSQ